MEENEDKKFAALKLRMQGMTNEGVAKQLDVSERTIRRWLSNKQKSHFEAKDNPWKLIGDFVVCGDIHIDTVSWEMIREMVVWAKKFEVKKLIIAGDLFSFSGLQNKYPKVYTTASVPDEIEMARKVFEYLFGWFSEIYWFIGNHDERFMSWFGAGINMENLASMFCPDGKRSRLFTNDCNFAWVFNGPKKKRWLVMHAYEYGKPLAVSARFSARYDCSVIQHHQHLAAEGLSENGRHTIIDNGCMCDQRLTKYATKRISSLPSFQKGFVILVGGQHVRYTQ